MRRRFSLAALGALTAAVLAFTLLAGHGGALVGSWQADIALDETQSVTLRYTFASDGTYTCALDPPGQSESGGVQLQGNYRALADRLYLSEGLDYAIDTAVYDHYDLRGDALTLLDSASGDLTGFYPLTLTREK